MQFRRRNGRQIILTKDDLAAAPTPKRDGNQTLIEAILLGDEPKGISLRKLQKDPPVRWDEQRKRWGLLTRMNG